MISHWDEVPWTSHEHGALRFERQSLSRQRGSAGANLSRYRIAAGERSMPQHVHVDEEELFFVLAGPVHRTRRDLGRAAGSKLSGLQHVSVCAGRRSSVRHCHSREDEIFVVLEGSGTLLLGDERHAVRPGSVVSRPAGTGVAHSFEAGDDPLVLLAYGTRDPDDTCWYPDSRKISSRGLGVIYRVEPLDYWDGEQ